MGNLWKKIWKRGVVNTDVESAVKKAACATSEPISTSSAPNYDVAFAQIDAEGETPQQKIKEFIEVLCGGYSPLMVFGEDGVEVRYVGNWDSLGPDNDLRGMDKYREAWVQRVPAVWIDAFFEVIQAPDAHQGYFEWDMEEWDWHVPKMLGDWSYKKEGQADWCRAVVKNLNDATLDVILAALCDSEPVLGQRVIEHLWPNVRSLTDEQLKCLMGGLYCMESAFCQSKFREIKEIFQDRPEVQRYLQLYFKSVD